MKMKLKAKAHKPNAVEFSEYKGQPLIVLRRSEDDKFPFQFGRAKAQLIVAYFEEIKRFAEGGDE